MHQDAAAGMKALVLSPSEPFEHALPRRRLTTILAVLSLLALSAGTMITGIWAIVGWLL